MTTLSIERVVCAILPPFTEAGSRVRTPVISVRVDSGLDTSLKVEISWRPSSFFFLYSLYTLLIKDNPTERASYFSLLPLRWGPGFWYWLYRFGIGKIYRSFNLPNLYWKWFIPHGLILWACTKIAYCSNIIISLSITSK